MMTSKTRFEFIQLADEIIDLVETARTAARLDGTTIREVIAANLQMSLDEDYYDLSAREKEHVVRDLTERIGDASDYVIDHIIDIEGNLPLIDSI
tara:strand:- start:4439 stop:4723 length:285 start_codon:yes stop_codon:yes gene_type:complete